MTISTIRYPALLLLFLAALISYAVGFIAGFWLFFAVGAILETVFWIRFWWTIVVVKHRSD
jgi:hypothetical protein